MLVTCGLLLLAGFGLQMLVYGNGGHSSLSDIPHLVLGRNLTPGHWPYVDRVLEYPVLGGLLLGAAVTIGSSPLGAFLVVVVLATGAALGIAWLLAQRFGARAWRWALGTPVLLFAFQNWDLFAVGALVIGLLAFERRRDRTAGIAFGLGAAVKLFPMIVVPPLVALRWAHGDRRGAARLATASVATFAVVNAPFAVYRRANWWWTYSFQSSRQATWGSAWFYLLRMVGLPVHGTTGAQVANVVGALAVVGGITWLVVRAVRNDLDPFAAAGAAVAICILANKVYSPTYDVWLVVFFVALPLSRQLWLTFCAVDLAVFAVVYGHFDGPVPIDVVRAMLPVLVVLRTAVLLAFVVRATERRVPIRVRVPALVGSR